jgi:hypothetical protein
MPPFHRLLILVVFLSLEFSQTFLHAYLSKSFYNYFLASGKNNQLFRNTYLHIKVLGFLPINVKGMHDIISQIVWLLKGI